MNIDEFKKKLRDERVRENMVNILGAAPRDFRMNLCLENGEYKVFYMEKGARSRLGEFSSLEDALDRFWEVICYDRENFFHL